MVHEAVVLGHIVPERGIEIDRAEIEVIEHLPPPHLYERVRSFLGRVGFYWWFIKDFSKITKPISLLLAKDTLFIFCDECHGAFYRINDALITASISQPLNWSLPFEIMSNASNYIVGPVLGQ